jgi:hypothetical protein
MVDKDFARLYALANGKIPHVFLLKLTAVVGNKEKANKKKRGSGACAFP